jgi:hypothetical protein
MPPGVLRRGIVVIRHHVGRRSMHGLIYLIGLIVVIMAILSFLGLR